MAKGLFNQAALTFIISLNPKKHNRHISITDQGLLHGEANFCVVQNRLKQLP